MKIAIIGGRDVSFKYYTYIKSILDKYVTNNDTIISGGAKGVDSMAELYAKERGINIIIYIPDYSKYGRKAPLVRDKTIAEQCDMMIAFPSKNSKGTWYTVNLAKKMGKKVLIFKIY